MFRALRTAPLLLLFLSACTRTERVPAYLELGSVSVNVTDAALQGSEAHKITDVWAYANDQSVGVWEVPSKIPVLSSGTTNLKMIAGIARNGVTDDRVQYPFYDTWSVDLSLIPEDETDIAPAFQYFDGLTFWVEDFEGVGFALDVEAGSDTTLDGVASPPEMVFEGGTSATVHLDTAHRYIRCVSFDSFDVPGSGPAYLELNYKCDHEFLIGAYITQGATVLRTPYLYVNSTKRADGGMPWNKIYVDLTPLMVIPGAVDEKFYLQMDLEDGETSAQFYFDNLKLIHP